MISELEKAFDECLSSLKKGATIEECLVYYPHLRSLLQPPLLTAQSIAQCPVISPSEGFRKASTERLINQIRQESQNKRAEPATANPVFSFGRKFKDLIKVKGTL